MAQLNDMYRFYRQLGADFMNENDKNRQIRSLNFDFGITEQSLHITEDCAEVDTSMFTPYGNKSIRQTFALASGSDFFHQHDYFELMYVLSGTVNVNIEGDIYRYEAGDAYLMNRFTRHIELHDCDNSVIYFCLSKSLADRLSSDLKKQRINKALDDFFIYDIEQEYMYKKGFLEFRANGSQNAPSAWDSAETLIAQIISEMTDLYPGYPHMVRALLIRLFYLLTNPAKYKTHLYHLITASDDHLMTQIKEYIVEKNGVISREEMASRFHFHPDYLNRLIRERTGMSLIHFAQKYRMQEAARMIRSSEKSISEISQSLGFPNKPYFYRLFKRTYQMTPAEYREFCRKN